MGGIGFSVLPPSLRKVPPKRHPYWTKVRIKAALLRSDGCTLVAEFYQDGCYEHDIHWRTGKTLAGEPISYEAANWRLALVIWSRASTNLTRNPKTWLNLFGYPMGAWRFVGTTVASTYRRLRGISPGSTPPQEGQQAP